MGSRSKGFDVSGLVSIPGELTQNNSLKSKNKQNGRHS